MLIPSKEAELRRVMRSERRPVAFVGSGLSTNHGPWKKFILELARYSGNKTGFDFISASDREPDLESLLAVADESVSCLPTPWAKDNFVQQFFEVPGRIPAAYGALVRAPFSFFITTNYDTNIEDAYRMYWGGIDLEVVRSGDPERALKAIASGKPFVFKIHGCARLGGPFIIGSSDYQHAIFSNPAVQSVLHAVFATHSIVFAGYGHRDPHIGIYLGYQRQVLYRGGPPHFTFIKKCETFGYDQVQYLGKRFGISCIEVDDWPIVEVILDQFSFLQLQDNYVGTRRENASHFHEFLMGNREAAWGALLYAFASSDIGRTEECFKLWEVVRDSAILKEHVERDPVLHFIFCIATGKVLKNKKLQAEAQHQFETIENLARDQTHLIRPLVCLGLRHAGIFWHPTDRQRADSLFAKAFTILGTEFPEELLDHRKWAALLASNSDPRKAVLQLVEIAEEADRLEYIKCAAWCRYSAAKFRWQYELLEPSIHLESDLMRAISAFEQLDHLRGLSESNYLLAEIWHSGGKDPSEILPRLEIARAMAVIAGYEPARKRCDALLSLIGSPPPP